MLTQAPGSQGDLGEGGGGDDGGDGSGSGSGSGVMLELTDIWRPASVLFEVLSNASVDVNDIWQLLKSEDPRHCLWLSFSWQITEEIFLRILPNL